MELYVQHPDTGRWTTVESTPDDIAITYQVNDLGEVDSRSSIASNTITIAPTSHNLGIFGVLGNPASTVSFPYRSVLCRLENRGSVLVDRGYLITESVGSGGIKCSILAGLFSFKTAIKDKLIAELFKGRTVEWTAEAVAGSHPAMEIAFPIVSYDGNEDNLQPQYIFPPFPDNAPATLFYVAQFIRPAVRFKSILEKIVSSSGYRLSLPDYLESDERLNSSFIPFSSISPSKDDIERELNQLAGMYGGVFTSSPAEAFAANLTLGYRTELFTGNVGVDNAFYFYPKLSGEYTFRFSTVFSTRWTSVAGEGNEKIRGARVSITISPPDEDPYTLTMNEDNDFKLFTVTIPRDRLVRFIVGIYIPAGQGEPVWQQGVLTVQRAHVEVIDARIDDVFGKRITVADKLPEISQVDFIRAFAQMFCLFIQVDELHKVVGFYSYRQLFYNKENGVAVDWSEKLHNEAPGISFKLPSVYGQRNRASYRSGKGFRGEDVLDEAFITIDNTSLEPDKKFFELPFTAGEDFFLNTSQQTVAHIRALERGEDESTTAGNADPFVVATKMVDFPFYTIGESGSISGTHYHGSSFAPMRMQAFIDSEYQALRDGLLNRMKLVTVPLWLTAADIAKLDFAVPVFIRQLGRYFYLNRVKSYLPNRLTEVELLAMEPGVESGILPPSAVFTFDDGSSSRAANFTELSHKLTFGVISRLGYSPLPFTKKDEAPDWLSVAIAESAIELSVEDNTSHDNRFASVSFLQGKTGKELMVNVYQSGVARAEFSFANGEKSASWSAGVGEDSTSFGVISSPYGFSVSASESWISASNDGGSVGVSVSPNMGAFSRDGMVILTQDTTLEEISISVYQNPA